MPSNENIRPSRSSEVPAFKIWRDDSQPSPITPQVSPLLAQLQKSFEEATGWVVEQTCLPSSPRRPGRTSRLESSLCITDLSANWPAGKPAVHRQKCDSLIAAIDDLWQSLERQSRWFDAAQLELGSQSVTGLRCNEMERLTQFLQRLLSVAAEQTGYDSVAAYAMADEPQQLVQRLSTGPLFAASSGSGRLLRDSRADQQALLGSLVVMNSPASLAQWGNTIAARSAVCLPISSMSQLLGTMWFASSTKRIEPTTEQTNLLELVAGRIAAEWERLALIRHVLRSPAEPDSSSAAPRRWQETDWPLLADPDLSSRAADHLSVTPDDLALPKDSLGRPGPIALTNPRAIVERLQNSGSADQSRRGAVQTPTLPHWQPQLPYDNWECHSACHDGPRHRASGKTAKHPHLCHWTITPQDTMLIWTAATPQANQWDDFDPAWWQELFQTMACVQARPALLLSAVLERLRRQQAIGENATNCTWPVAVAEIDPLTGEFEYASTERLRLQASGGILIAPARLPELAGQGQLRVGQHLQFAVARSARKNPQWKTLSTVSRK